MVQQRVVKVLRLSVRFELLGAEVFVCLDDAGKFFLKLERRTKHGEFSNVLNVDVR